jgi:hypothetical protein
LLGGDEHALVLARALLTARILRVEAVSVGCPKDITPSRGRKGLAITLADSGDGWILEGLAKVGSWHATPLEAVVYAATRTTAQDTEIRIVGAQGEVTHVLLVPGRRGATIAPVTAASPHPSSRPQAASATRRD